MNFCACLCFCSLENEKQIQELLEVFWFSSTKLYAYAFLQILILFIFSQAATFSLLWRDVSENKLLLDYHEVPLSVFLYSMVLFDKHKYCTKYTVTY